MNYFRKFQEYLGDSKLDDFFGQILHQYQINGKNILLLETSSSSKNTDFCFCDWERDRIIEFKSFNAFWMLGEQKINLASKTCNPLASAENISELFDIMYDSVGRDILLVFNMKGAGATVPKHFHMQVFNNAMNSEVFRIVAANLEVSEFIDENEKRKWFSYDLLNVQFAREEFFNIKKLNTPIEGLNFELKQKWVLQLEYSLQLRELVKDSFCKIIDYFFKRCSYKDDREDNFAFNFLFHSGLGGNKFSFNIIFRNPKMENGFESLYAIKDPAPTIDKSTRTQESKIEELLINKRWGWLESIGGLRFSRELVSIADDRVSSETLQTLYQKQRFN